jgi:hypothetical protein
MPWHKNDYPQHCVNFRPSVETQMLFRGGEPLVSKTRPKVLNESTVVWMTKIMSTEGPLEARSWSRLMIAHTGAQVPKSASLEPLYCIINLQNDEMQRNDRMELWSRTHHTRVSEPRWSCSKRPLTCQLLRLRTYSMQAFGESRKIIMGCRQSALKL